MPYRSSVPHPSPSIYHTLPLDDAQVIARRHSFSLAHQVCSYQRHVSWLSWQGKHGKVPATVVPAGLVDELSEFRGAGEWARLITEPVYLGFGEHEFPTSFREEPSAYGSFSITLTILKEAAHCPFFEPNRHEMFDDIAA